MNNPCPGCRHEHRLYKQDPKTLEWLAAQCRPDPCVRCDLRPLPNAPQCTCDRRSDWLESLSRTCPLCQQCKDGWKPDCLESCIKLRSWYLGYQDGLARCEARIHKREQEIVNWLNKSGYGHVSLQLQMDWLKGEGK